MKHMLHLVLSILCCLAILHPSSAQCDYTLSTNITNVQCSGGNNGAVNLTVTGGTGPFVFQWSDNTTTEDVWGLSAGIYTVTVFDGAGCTTTTQATITQPSQFVIAAADEVLTCVNNPGLISVSVTSGAAAPYTWQLGNGINGTSTAATFFVGPVSQSGLYAVTVTNANGCTAVDQSVVTANTVIPLASAGTNQTLTCNNTFLTLDGGESSLGPVFNYNWTTTSGNIVSATNTLSPVVNLPGIYTLTVTNTQNGCTATDEVLVFQDTSTPVFSVPAHLGLPCSGGSVTIPVTVLPTMICIWSGPGNFVSNVQNPIVNTAGSYTVTVTNPGNGCTSTATVMVFPGPLISAQNFAVTNLPCTPGALGAIDLTVNFGTGPYTYLWSNLVATEDQQNLSSGTYTVLVTDATGCSYYGVTTVTQNSNIEVSFTSTPTCFGTNSGSIDATASGGAAPYTYEWTGPFGFHSNVQNISNVTAGNFTVTVTDATGCTKSATANIPAPLAIGLSPSNVVIQSVTCHGGSNGFININPTGGAPPYSFDWSNDGPETPDNDTQNLNSLQAGTYTVTITDTRGCSLEPAPFVIAEPPALHVSPIMTHIPCPGTGEGQAGVSVSGGVAPYSYLWSNGASLQSISVVFAGLYTVTVTDSNECTAVCTVNILKGGETIPQGDFSVVPASCELGASDGSITLNNLPSNAVAPLSFFWVSLGGHFGFTQNITGLKADTYILRMDDANGCQFVANVVVDKLPGDLTAGIVNNGVTCSTGSLSATVSGGTPPYAYDWSNSSTTATIQYYASGTYTVTITDANGCSNTSSTTVTMPPAIVINETVTEPTCAGGSLDAAINIVVSGGNSPYTYIWNTGTSTNNLSGLGSGTYCITVTDMTGCTATKCIVIQPIAPLTISPTITNPTCNIQSNGFVTINLINPGSPPYSWITDGAAPQGGDVVWPQFTISNLAGTTYCVTVTNADGCSTLNCFTLTAPPPVIVQIEELSNTCNSALLRANVLGGVPPLTYSWESGAATITDETPIIVAPYSTIYQVFVLDANGCGDFALHTVELANGGNCGYIRGTVADDDNGDCVVDANEARLANWLVRAEGQDTLYGVTNASGNYLINVPTGSYRVVAIPPNALWQTCPPGNLVTVTGANDTAFGGNIPVQGIISCPQLTVSIGTFQLRRCFSNNYYYVEYCNEGTTQAEDAYIDVVLDPFLLFNTSSIPGVNVGANTWRFTVGDLDPGECGYFNINCTVSCNAVLGQTHCTEAHIYPDVLCSTDPNWSGSNLIVKSNCDADSIRFVIKNTGVGNMGSTVDYIVVEDAVMIMQAPVPQLNAGDSIRLAFPANGSTWRVEVGQEAFHPYPQSASLSIEGCTLNSSFSTGFVNQFSPNDPSPNVDIDCTSNTGSYDPNDKQGFPLGYGTEHFINPGTEINYKIRFQNTGTDTAFTVRILDTLAVWLDPTTVKFGASSHPYRYDINGEGVVNFIFENILLPDSNVNEAASHGFAQFTIKPRVGTPLQTLIENSAAIYFDYNDPIITNTTFHRVGEKFITVGLWQPHVPELSVTATPNPFFEETLLEIKGLRQNGTLKLQVFDYQGVEVRQMESDTALFRLKRGSWASGIYFFKITRNGTMLGSGKLVAP